MAQEHVKFLNSAGVVVTVPIARNANGEVMLTRDGFLQLSKMILDASGLTDIRTLTVQDVTGTIALVADITAAIALYYTKVELDGGQLNNLYFTEIEHLNVSLGAGSAGKPIKLDAGGLVSSSMIDDSGIDHGALAGLADDDHTQYHLTDGSRDITGDILPNAAGTLDLGNGTKHFALIYQTTSIVRDASFNTKMQLSGPNTHMQMADDVALKWYPATSVSGFADTFITREAAGIVGFADASEFAAQLDFSAMTADRAITFQDVAGTIALQAEVIDSLLTTRGDIAIRDATSAIRLPKGTLGQVLEMGADEPAWATPAASGGGVGSAGNLVRNGDFGTTVGEALFGASYPVFWVSTAGGVGESESEILLGDRSCHSAGRPSRLENLLNVHTPGVDTMLSGEEITLSGWCWCNTASHARIGLHDGTTFTYSGYHTGGSSWEYLTVTATMKASPTVKAFTDTGSAIANRHFSGLCLVMGATASQFVPHSSDYVDRTVPPGASSSDEIVKAWLNKTIPKPGGGTWTFDFDHFNITILPFIGSDRRRMLGTSGKLKDKATGQGYVFFNYETGTTAATTAGYELMTEAGAVDFCVVARIARPGADDDGRNLWVGTYIRDADTGGGRIAPKQHRLFMQPNQSTHKVDQSRWNSAVSHNSTQQGLSYAAMGEWIYFAQVKDHGTSITSYVSFDGVTWAAVDSPETSASWCISGANMGIFIWHNVNCGVNGSFDWCAWGT